MSSIIDFTKESNSEFSYTPYTYETSVPIKLLNVDDFSLLHAYALPKEDLSGKAHLTNKQTVGISLLVSSIFFGILALMFPQASVPYALYIGLSGSCAVAGGVLLASREKPVEIPLASEFYEFC